MNANKRYKFGLLALVFCSCFVGSSGDLLAANRALLIAPTEYKDPIYDLPGIIFDISEMELFARKIGFSNDQIKKITGSSVTVANIKQEFRTFLTNGVSGSDTILIYYSGHGLQVPDKNGDEDDRRDEALSMHDLEPAVSGWDGVLIDDDFADLLQQLPSENVVVIVDACHSGTITRSFTNPVKLKTRAYGTDAFAVKSLAYRGAKTRAVAGATGTVTDSSPAGIVTLSAAQDDQQSLASNKGSLFTLALSEALDSQRDKPTLESLMRTTTALLGERLDEDNVFTPNLTGDAQLFGKNIVIGAAEEREKVNWSVLLSLSADMPDMSMSIEKQSYEDSDPISISVVMPDDGYVNILGVDASDEIVVLFPNGLDRDNSVSAGTNNFPGNRGFEWVTQPPWGQSMIVVLYSKARIDLFESSLQKNKAGESLANYVLPSNSSLDVFRSTSLSKAVGKVFLSTCETASLCNRE